MQYNIFLAKQQYTKNIEYLYDEMTSIIYIIIFYYLNIQMKKKNNIQTKRTKRKGKNILNIFERN